jgi:hypothetical protein
VPPACGQTRLHVRVGGRPAPWWLTVGYIAVIIPADFIMATGMLRGLKQRAENPTPRVPPGPRQSAVRLAALMSSPPGAAR